MAGGTDLESSNNNNGASKRFHKLLANPEDNPRSPSGNNDTDYEGMTDKERAKMQEKEEFLAGLDKHKYEKMRIVKNVAVLGIAFMLHFTAFHGTANLQSSVNTDASLGTFTLASVYGSLILSNIFLPVIVIRYFGCKWTVALSFIAYMPFIASQFYPRFYTLIPSGLFVGFGGGPLWCAKCTYLSVVAEAFSTIVGGRIRTEVLVVRFFGLFFVFYQMAQVWGNLISSSVLSMDDDVMVTLANLTHSSEVHAENVARLCGARYCPGVTAAENPNLVKPDPARINTLSGIFLGCMIGACLLVAFGVDSLKRYEMGRKGSGSDISGFRLLAVTLRHLTKRYQLLLLPITMFIGAAQAFVNVDFTAGFVACGWGISKIGYAMICFGVINAIGSALAGALTKLAGQMTVLTANAVLHISLILWMINWEAVAGDFWTYCAMAGLWGLADGIWLVQINAASGILFPGQEEAAFSNFRLLEASGSVLAYSISPSLCTKTKLYFLIVAIVVGMIGYSTIEYFERRAKKGKVDERKFEPVQTDETKI